MVLGSSPSGSTKQLLFQIGTVLEMEIEMNNDLADRLLNVAEKHGLMYTDLETLEEAASALRSSGEAVAAICGDPFQGTGFSQWVRTDEILPIGTKLYLHSATPASAWRPIAEAPNGRIVWLWMPAFDNYAEAAWKGRVSWCDRSQGPVKVELQTPLVLGDKQMWIELGDLPYPTHFMPLPAPPTSTGATP